jgi:uncharacterized protein (TIGR03435 family)
MTAGAFKRVDQKRAEKRRPCHRGRLRGEGRSQRGKTSGCDAARRTKVIRWLQFHPWQPHSFLDTNCLVYNRAVAIRMAVSMLLFFISAAATNAAGQTTPQFDAATIKPEKEGIGSRRMQGGPGTSSPGRVTWQRVQLKELLWTAFNTDPGRLSGPAWIGGGGGRFYSFACVMPPDTSEHDFERMLQAFLIDQFKIKLHHQSKMFPAYDLVVAPGGPRLKASADPNAPDMPSRMTGPPKIGPDGFAVAPPGHGVRARRGHGFHGTFQVYSMPEFAQYISGWLAGGSTVYVSDKTGLTGRYDFKLEFDADAGGVVLGPAAEPLG